MAIFNVGSADVLYQQELLGKLHVMHLPESTTPRARKPSNIIYTMKIILNQQIYVYTYWFYMCECNVVCLQSSININLPGPSFYMYI